MGNGDQRSSGAEREGGGRPVVYCLVPRELAPRLHELLRHHFRDSERVEVVVERRRTERRSDPDRRLEGAEPAAVERRKIRSVHGRRVGERRAALIPIEPPELPRRARQFAGRLAFVERLEPASEHAEDLDTARLVDRIQAGDRDAFEVLYRRYFDRVYGYMRMALRDAHEAEDATQGVFIRVLEGLPHYERRRQPFRAWLFIVARNFARDHVAKWARIEPMDEEQLDYYNGRAASAPDTDGAELGGSSALSWISNNDLLVLIERLPPAQRQVLALRYMLGLRPNEIAVVMGIPPNRVSVHHYRALAFLRDRLKALGREPRRPDRATMARMPNKATVLRLRRFALRG